MSRSDKTAGHYHCTGSLCIRRISHLAAMALRVYQQGFIQLSACHDQPDQSPVPARQTPRRRGNPRDLHLSGSTGRRTGCGQILVKNEYLSLDPAMRGWMNEGKSYIPPVGLGEVMRAWV
jgi:hypothetical protein